jgi:hemerythrin superfamily protein
MTNDEDRKQGKEIIKAIEKEYQIPSGVPEGLDQHPMTDMSEMIATNKSITNQLRNAEIQKNDPGYYNNNIDRFYKMVDSTDTKT